MKSVLPNVTERILRPRIVCRNPRATVSTSGSSGIGRENLQNSTAVGPMLYSEPGISGSFFGAFEKRTGKQISRVRSEEHTSELQSRLHLVCRLLLEKKKNKKQI